MSVTYDLSGGEFPIPIAQQAPVLGNGSTGPFSSGMSNVGTSTRLDQFAYAIPIIAGQQGTGGYGVVGDGLQVTEGTGLQIVISGGIVLVDGWLELIDSGTPNAVQVLLLSGYALEDDAVNFVWVTASGGIAINSTVDTPPANARILIANVTTAAGSITNIDYSGREGVSSGAVVRQTGDRCAPADTPPAAVKIQTVTSQGNTFTWNGLEHAPASTPVVALTLTTTLTLDENDYGVFSLTPSGGDQTVKLPGTPKAGKEIFINNAAATGGHNIVLKDATGTVTVSTLTPGQYAPTGPALPGGSSSIPVYPREITPIGGGGAGAVSVDAHNQQSDATGPVLTWSHTCNAAAEMLVVGIVWHAAATAVVSVTYNGVAMTVSPEGIRQGPLGGVNAVQYYLPNPTAGAHSVVVTLDTTGNMAAASISFLGASGAIGNHNGGVGNSTSVAETVVGAPGDMAVDIACGLAALTSLTTVEESGTIGSISFGASVAPAANPTNLGYGQATSQPWATTCLVIQAA